MMPVTKRMTLTVDDEWFFRDPGLPRQIQKFIAKEAGYMITNILLDTGIEKGSPIYIDSPRQQTIPMTRTTEIDLEVTYTPPTPKRPQLEAASSPTEQETLGSRHHRDSIEA